MDLRKSIQELTKLAEEKRITQTKLKTAQEAYEKNALEKHSQAFKENIIPKIQDMINNLNEMKNCFPEFFKSNLTIDGTYKYGYSPIVYFLKETVDTITQKYDGTFDVYEEPEYKLCGHICYEDETKENSIEINFGRDKGNICLYENPIKGNIYLYENPIKIYDNDKENIIDFLNKEAIEMFDTLIDTVNRTINDYLYSNKQILENDIKSLYRQIDKYNDMIKNDEEQER